MVEAFNFSEELTARAAAMQDRPKRVRSKALLVAATARQMEQVGYEVLTVDNIAREAGMARGTFYLYFENRRQAAQLIARAYWSAVRRRRPRGIGRHGLFEALLEANRYYVANYAANAGIMACREAMMREDPNAARLRDHNNHVWSLDVVRDLDRRCGAGARDVPKALKLLHVRAVMAMADELLREIFILKAPHLRSAGRSTDQLAELLSLHWYRALFGQDVAPAQVDKVRPLLDLRLAEG